MDETFRLRRYYRNMGLGFLPFFLAMGGLGLYALRIEPVPPHPVAAACFALSFPLFMVGGSIWMIAAYWRARWTFRDGRVTARDVFHEKTIDLAEVTSARWQWGMEWGAVRLRTESDRLTLTFGSFERVERERIVRHLRETLPPEVQVDWNLYAYKVKPFEPPKSPKTKPGPDEILIRRDRYDRNFVPFMALASLLGAVFWRVSGEWRPALGFPVVTLAGLMLLRFSTPAEGMVAKKPSFKSDDARFFRFVALWVPAGLACMIVYGYFKRAGDENAPILIVGAVVWAAVFFYEVYLYDRRTMRREREAADLAAKGRGEAMTDAWTSD